MRSANLMQDVVCFDLLFCYLREQKTFFLLVQLWHLLVDSLADGAM